MRSRRAVLTAAALGCFEGRVLPGRARAAAVPVALPPELLRRISFSYSGTLDGAAEALASRIGYGCIPLDAPPSPGTWPVGVSIEATNAPRTRFGGRSTARPPATPS